MLTDRILAFTDEADSALAAEKIRAFQIFLLMHVTARLWIWALRPRDISALPQTLAAVLITACFVLGFSRRWARTATIIAAAVLFVKIVATFPHASNHAFLEWLCMTLLAVLDPRNPANAALVLQANRWIVVIILFWSGLQKFLHGTYFDARFFGVSIAQAPTFADIFRPLLSPEEFGHLIESNPRQVGAGPFAIRSLIVVALSNATYLFEIAAGPLLLIQRTRVATTFLCLAFLVFIEAGAREIMFGAVFMNLLLLFDVNFREHKFAVGFVRQLLQDRRKLLTRLAPRRPEINDDWQI